MLAGSRHALALLFPVVSSLGCHAEPTATREPTAPSAAAPSAKPTQAAAPAASPTAEPEGGLAPNPNCSVRRNTGELTACEAYKGSNLGGWTPTAREAADVMKLASGACYCARDLDVPALACAKRVKSATMKLQVGKLGDPTDCAITLSSAEWKGRRWVIVEAINRDVSTFYTTLTIYERSGGFRPYYQGFNGLPDDEGLKNGAEGVFPEMKRDWPKLPVEVRKAFGWNGP